jgi:hypothetical protein
MGFSSLDRNNAKRCVSTAGPANFPNPKSRLGKSKLAAASSGGPPEEMEGEESPEAIECFCCLRGNEETKVMLLGCSCVEWYACASCLYQTGEAKNNDMMGHAGWETRCTVCTGQFGDKTILSVAQFAQDASEKLLPFSEERLTAELNVIGILMRMHDKKAAWSSLTETRARYEKELGPKHGSVSFILHRFAHWHRLQDQFQEELSALFESFKIQNALVLHWNTHEITPEDAKWMYQLQVTLVMTAEAVALKCAEDHEELIDIVDHIFSKAIKVLVYVSESNGETDPLLVHTAGLRAEFHATRLNPLETSQHFERFRTALEYVDNALVLQMETYGVGDWRTMKTKAHLQAMKEKLQAASAVP